MMRLLLSMLATLATLTLIAGQAHAQIAPAVAPTPIPVRGSAGAAPPVVQGSFPAGVPDLAPIVLQRPVVHGVPDFSAAAQMLDRRHGRPARVAFGNRGEAAQSVSPRDRTATAAIAARRIVRTAKLARYRVRLAVPLARRLR